MKAQEDTPIRCLCLEILATSLPHKAPEEADKWRKKILAAAADEIEWHAARGRTNYYDPLLDIRVKWALRWVDVLAGRFHDIPADLDFCAKRVIHGLAAWLLSGKELAAGEGRELETLAQG